MKAKITDIKRFAVHDGDGIRTTVFFKGCPMRCIWCHNPEGLIYKSELAFYFRKCTFCGECQVLCKYHSFIDDIHKIDINSCNLCSECVNVCPNEALKIFGQDMDLYELFDILLRDKQFYDNSGGGITLSGGECLMQADFCKELLKMCKENYINTAIDTCGYVNRESLEKVIPYTDVFLYDLKAFDDDVHMKCTGVSNKLIFDNLMYIDSLGCKIEIRIPYVPEYTDSEIEKLSDFVLSLKNVIRTRILPYHNYAGSKYEALGMKNTLPNVRIPTDTECEELMSKYFHRTN